MSSHSRPANRATAARIRGVGAMSEDELSRALAANHQRFLRGEELPPFEIGGGDNLTNHPKRQIGPGGPEMGVSTNGKRATRATSATKSAAPKTSKTPKVSAKATTPKAPASKLAQLQTAEQRARLGTPEQQAAKRALLDYVTTPARMKPVNEADQAYLRAVNAEIDARKANTQRGYGPSPAVREAVAAKEAAHTALLKASNDFLEKYGVDALEAMAHAGAKRAAARATTRAKRAAKKAQA